MSEAGGIRTHALRRKIVTAKSAVLPLHHNLMNVMAMRFKRLSVCIVFSFALFGVQWYPENELSAIRLSDACVFL